MPLYALGDSRPTCHPTAWIAPSAEVIGAAVLGEATSLWFGAVIRADNTAIVVGARTNIQDGAMLHSDLDVPLVVGAGCTIGHHAILHGCTIGDGVMVGMGATVLNHAAIERDSIVGANALVTEGKRFPPRSLIVGAPARLIRTLADGEVAMLRTSAAHYVARARRYAEGLYRID